MKKIIWLFGESATGKLTLIKNILENKNNIREKLGLDNEIIDVVYRTIENNLSAFDDKNSENNRQSSILGGIDNFINSNQTVLLIKGQCNDMDERYGNILKKFALTYPDMEKEIYLLEISDYDLHYQRFINKDWYKEDVERYSKMFTREWLPGAVERHRKQVMDYSDFGFKITRIDSTNEYKIKDEIKLNEKSNSLK